MNEELEQAQELGLIAVVGVPAEMPPRETEWALNGAYEFAAKLRDWPQGRT